MSDNSQAVTIIESRKNVSSKRIKIEALRGSEGIQINGQALQSYLENDFIEQIERNTIEESRQDIGICRKPVIRYARHKEANGTGKILQRSEINRLYMEKNMENLNKIQAPLARYVITALLSGDALTYGEMRQYILEKGLKKVPISHLMACVSLLRKKEIGIFFEKVDTDPIRWAFKKQALEISENDLYAMTKKSKLTMDLKKACRKYPGIVEVIKKAEIKEKEETIMSKEEKLQELIKKNAPVMRFFIMAMLDGKPWSNKALTDFVNKYFHRKCNQNTIHSTMNNFKRSRIGFIIKRVAMRPSQWQFDNRALCMSESDIYDMTWVKGNLSLEQACLKYPSLIDILEDQNVNIPIPEEKEEKDKAPAPIEKPELPTFTNAAIPEPDEDKSALSQSGKAIKAITSFIDQTGGKFDINININFRVLFGARD